MKESNVSKLLDRIKELETEIERLKEQLTSQQVAQIEQTEVRKQFS
jgi:uncharacterized small protein (DUF1192 family)